MAPRGAVTLAPALDVTAALDDRRGGDPFDDWRSDGDADTRRETISVLPTAGRCEQPAWRQDFPIDWPQDHYVERRDFVKFLTLTSLAFVVGQFWIAGQNWLRGRQRPPGAASPRSARSPSAPRSSSTIPTITTPASWSGCPKRSSWRSARSARTCRAR